MNQGQQKIDQWFTKHNWAYWTPHEILARLTEEVGELARLVNHEYGPKPKKSTERAQEFEEEIGDIMYTLACFANKHDIDLDEALQRSIHKSETRDKNRF
jgi:NTP pyrophosphatase (non-canonical NTP hydrolase)